MTTTASTNGVGGLEWHDLSSQVRPRRRYEGAVPPPGDEAAEGHLRLILARKVADVLGPRPRAASQRFRYSRRPRSRRSRR